MFNLFHPITQSVVTTTIVSYSAGSIWAEYDEHLNASSTAASLENMLLSEILNNSYFLYADNSQDLLLSPRVEDVSVNGELYRVIQKKFPTF